MGVRKQWVLVVNYEITLYGSEQRCGNHVAPFDCGEGEGGITRTMKWQAIDCLKLSSACALHTPHYVCVAHSQSANIYYSMECGSAASSLLFGRSRAGWNEKVNIIVIAGATPSSLCDVDSSRCD